MFQKKAKVKSSEFLITSQKPQQLPSYLYVGTYIIIFIAMLFCVLPSCVSPKALQTEIQGIRMHMEGMEKVTDELSVWKKNVQAETINYGGAGWVVVGVGTVVLIFVGAGLLLIRAFMRRGSMLTMLTKAVKSAGKNSPHIILAIKEHLKCSVKEGYFREQDRKNIGHFARKRGHFVEQK